MRTEVTAGSIPILDSASVLAHHRPVQVSPTHPRELAADLDILDRYPAETEQLHAAADRAKRPANENG